MNIGFFSEVYSPDINGVITSMKNFKDELERAGHKVYIFAPDTKFFGKTTEMAADTICSVPSPILLTRRSASLSRTSSAS